MSLYSVQELCSGFRQFTQQDILEEFTIPFFDNILNTVNTRAKNIAEPMFYGLRPNMKANQEEIDHFEKFHAKLLGLPEEERGDGYTRMKKWIVETLCDLREKKNAREISL